MTDVAGENQSDTPSVAAEAEQSVANINHSQQNELRASAAKIYAFIGIIAITLGNVSTFLTHVDEIRQFISKVLGTQWVAEFHTYVVYGGCALLLFGYGSLTYWLYWNFFANRTRWIKVGFCVAALIAIGSTVLGSYEFLFRPVDFAPLIRKQTNRYVQTVLSQQVIAGEDNGGFRFSQAGISNDTQAWTTAQSIVALLQQQDASISKGPAIRQAFDYIERLRLKTPNDGWGYLKGFTWGVTEIDAWVALAYIYSLRPDNALAVWGQNEIPEKVAKTNEIIKLLIDRQHDDGGWSPIEKTSNPRHERTYSTIMAIWMLAEAEQNGDILKGHDAEYRAALTLGAKWLLESYTTSSEGFSGWWPNPSTKNPVGSYPALEAQALFVLSSAKAAHSFIGADPKYKKAIETFIDLALDGNDKFESLQTRKLSNNERPHDSDRYLEGRTETVEQYTFLWYPWTIALGATLEHDPLLLDLYRERLRKLLSSLLERADEEDTFVRNDEVIYPTDEILFAEGYYFSRSEPTLKQK